MGVNWGQVVGTVGGGALGFAIGGPAGAGIGAGLGSQLGKEMANGNMNREEAARRQWAMGDAGQFQMPGYGQAVKRYGALERNFGGRTAPQAGQSSFRGDQRALGRMLAREAQGNGIGQQLVRAQAQGQADQAYRQQLSAAASARPGQGALATRQAMMNSGNATSMVGGQAAQAAGQYTLGAQQNYGGFLQGARGQDDAMAQFNVDAKLRQLGLNDQAQLAALQQQLAARTAQQQGNIERERQKTQRYAGAMGAPTSGEQWLGATTGLLGGYMQMKGAQAGKTG